MASAVSLNIPFIKLSNTQYKLNTSFMVKSYFTQWLRVKAIRIRVVKNTGSYPKYVGVKITGCQDAYDKLFTLYAGDFANNEKLLYLNSDNNNYGYLTNVTDINNVVFTLSTDDVEIFGEAVCEVMQDVYKPTTLTAKSNIDNNIYLNRETYISWSALSDADITGYSVYCGHTYGQSWKITTASLSAVCPVNIFGNYSSGQNEIVVKGILTVNGFSFELQWGAYSTFKNVSTYAPIVTAFNISHTTRDLPTQLSWGGTDFNQWQIELWQDGNMLHSNTGATQTTYSVPVGVIRSLSAINVKLRLGYNGVYSPYTEKSFTPQATTPTLDNLTQIGDLWEQPITMNWRSTNQSRAEIEVYQNNVRVKVDTINNQQTYVIPVGTLTQKDNCSFRIRPLFVSSFDSTLITYGSWVERTLSLKDITATISNLLVSGDMWEKPINLSWLSENQEQFKVEVSKNNVIVKTYTGTTAKNYTIAANELSVGPHTIRVWVGYKNRFVNSSTKDVTLKDITPTIDNVAVSGSNIDLQLSLSWQSTDQQKYEVQIFKGDVVAKTYSGTTATSLIIPPSTLTTGVHIFKVRVAYKDRWTEWKSTQVTLTETLPSIGVLEPDGRIVDRDTAINVYWTSQNQTSWELKIGANVYTGTSETSKLLPIGLLPTGRQSMTLTVTLAIAGKNKLTAKTVEFIVQGKPPVPTFTNSATFTNNRPTFTWDSQDSQAYELSCGDYTTGWVNGLVNTCKIGTYLPNGTYTAKLRVKNQYNIASDYATQQIVINAPVITPPVLRVYGNATYNILNWDMVGYSKAYVLRDGVVIAVADDGYIDHTCHTDNNYQILCVTSNDVSVVSNIVAIRNDFDYPVISDMSDVLELVYRASATGLRVNYSAMSSKQYYSGRRLPITRHGEHEDRTYSFDYVELGAENYFKLLEMVARKKPLLYRSHNRKLWLTFDSITFDDNSDNIVYSINAYEVDMSEVVEYE